MHVFIQSFTAKFKYWVAGLDHLSTELHVFFSLADIYIFGALKFRLRIPTAFIRKKKDNSARIQPAKYMQLEFHNKINHTSAHNQANQA